MRTTMRERCDGALSGLIPHAPSLWGIAGTARGAKNGTSHQSDMGQRLSLTRTPALPRRVGPWRRGRICYRLAAAGGAEGDHDRAGIACLPAVDALLKIPAGGSRNDDGEAPRGRGSRGRCATPGGRRWMQLGRRAR